MKKQNYIAPEVDIFEVQVEAGFAQSNGETSDYDPINSPWG